MKKLVSILFFIFLFFISSNVYAATLSFSGDSSAETGSNYTVNLSYNGDVNLGSITVNVNYSNATCTMSSSVSGAIVNGNRMSVSSTTGLGTNVTLVTLSCTSSSAGTASFSVSSDDIWNETGEEEISVSFGSKSVTITNPAPPPTPEPDPEPTPEPEPNKPKDPEPNKPDKPKDPEPTPEPEPVDPNEPIPGEPDLIQEKLDATLFEIVGYPISYNVDINSYTIKVNKDVTELVLNVQAAEDILVEGAGRIDITNKNSIEIKLTKGEIVRTIIINLDKTPNEIEKPVVDDNSNTKDKKNDSIIPYISYGLNVLLIAGCIYLFLQLKKEKEKNAELESDDTNLEDNSSELASNVSVAEESFVEVTSAPQVTPVSTTAPATVVPVATAAPVVNTQPVQVATIPAVQPTQINPEPVASQTPSNS